MTATVAPLQSDVFTALRGFILGLIACEVIQGLGNGVSMPAGPFIALTELFHNRLSTNTSVYADPTPTTGTVTKTQALQATFQIDCYGPQSSDWANILTTLLRDEYGCNALAPNVQPLNADDPKMMPLIDGEQNYEQRWTITALFQVNPAITLPMQFADQVQVGLVGVNETYPV